MPPVVTSKFVLRGIPVFVTRRMMEEVVKSEENSAFTPYIVYFDFRQGKIRPLVDASRLGTCWIALRGNYTGPLPPTAVDAFIQWAETFRWKEPTSNNDTDNANNSSAPNGNGNGNLDDIADEKEIGMQVEWAPQRKIPRLKKTKDSKAGTIEQNPDYQAFLVEFNKSPEEKAAQEKERLAAAAAALQSSKPTSSPTSSLTGSVPITLLQPRSIPIIDFLKAAELKARDEKLREKERQRRAARNAKLSVTAAWGKETKPLSTPTKSKSKAVLKTEEKKKLQEKKKAKEKAKREAARLAALGIDPTSVPSPSLPITGVPSTRPSLDIVAKERLRAKAEELKFKKWQAKQAKLAEKLAQKAALKEANATNALASNPGLSSSPSNPDGKSAPQLKLLKRSELSTSAPSELASSSSTSHPHPPSQSDPSSSSSSSSLPSRPQRGPKPQARERPRPQSAAANNPPLMQNQPNTADNNQLTFHQSSQPSTMASSTATPLTQPTPAVLAGLNITIGGNSKTKGPKGDRHRKGKPKGTKEDDAPIDDSSHPASVYVDDPASSASSVPMPSSSSSSRRPKGKWLKGKGQPEANSSQGVSEGIPPSARIRLKQNPSNDSQHQPTQ